MSRLLARRSTGAAGRLVAQGGLLAASVLWASLAAAQSAPVFIPAGNEVLTGLIPQRAHVEDVDGDGHLDLLVTSSGYLLGSPSGQFEGSSLSLLFGDGAGGFPTRIPLDVGQAPWGITTGDFDGDQLPDLAVTQGTQLFGLPDLLCADDPGVNVFRGDGQGGFSFVTCLHGSTFPIAVSANDVDGDAVLDLVVGYNVIGGIQIARGLGNGTFGAYETVPQTVNLHVTDLVVTDADLDGLLDVAVSHYDGANVYRGHGDGTFVFSGAVEHGILTRSLAIGDVTADGIPDIATVRRYTGELTVTAGSGGGAFAITPMYTTIIGTDGRAVEMVDVDGDDRMDMVATGENDNGGDRVWIVASRPTGFVRVNYPVGNQPAALAVGDFIEDQRPDFAVALQNDANTPYFTLFENRSQPGTWPAPVAGFSASPTTGEFPLAVSFEDTSTGGPVSSWAWSFGDGTTSPYKHPVHTYAAAGVYTVGLTVSGPGGTDTFVAPDLVTVGEPPPVASFGADVTSGFNPLTVHFQDHSTGTITSWSWDFGDGVTSDLQGPTHTYTSAGFHTVSLTVTGPGGKDTQVRVNYIVVQEPPPVAAFAADVTLGPLPLAVSFTDLSRGGPVTSWSWDFGDGGTSNLPNPVHVYTVAGTYTVRLSAGGPGGLSSATEPGYITVLEAAPVAAFTATPTTGVVPLVVAFTDTSGSGPVSSWSWDFGDGGSSTAQHPVHTYTVAGSYAVSLTVSGPGGSDTLTLADLVTVAEPAPVAAFTATPTTGVLPLDVTFTDTSGSGPVSSWSWDFGDGGSSTAQHPVHTYTVAGSYAVALTVSGPGGSDTLTLADLVTVAEPAPVAAFAATPTTGVLPLDVTFTDTSGSGPVSSWSWDFGDGGSSTAQHPVHTYTVAGSYAVALTVSGPGGSDTLTLADLVTVAEPAPVAAFAATPTTGVLPLDVTFTDTSGSGPVSSWNWDFGDGGSSTDQHPVHTYTVAGSYAVGLTVSGPGGSDTLTLADLVTVTEPAPVAAFAATPTSGVLPLAVAFTDTSGGGPVSSWTWDFGDGAGSTTQHPQHTYTVAGSYAVALTVSGPGGSDTLTLVDLVTVAEPAPVAAFTATPTSGVLPLAVAFTDTSGGGPVSSWTWDFGDGAGSTTQHPQHTYTSAGTYAVSLTVTGPGGSDTLALVDLVTVSEPAPVAAFTATPTSGVLPLAVTFTDISRRGPVTSWTWDFGDGAGSTTQHPQHTYTAAGIYTVSLTASGPGGSDTATLADLVRVTDPAPVAAFAATPTSGMAPLAVAFANRSTGGPITSSSWDFGDGGTSSDSNPIHVYTAGGLYSVRLEVTGPGGTDMLVRDDLVSVAESAPVADFAADPTSGLAPLAVAFTSTSRGGAATGWMWDFGDGSRSAAEHPTHVYTLAGVYTVSFMISGPGGSDSTTQPALVTVVEPPPIAAFAADQTSGLADLTVAFHDESTGGLVTGWTWDFGDGTGSSERDPAHVYTQPGTYDVRLVVAGPGGSDDLLEPGFIVVLHDELLLGDRVQGSLEPGEVHRFRFEAVDGTRLGLRARRSGKTALEPGLRVFDPAGVELFTEEESVVNPMLARIGGPQAVLPATGSYRLEVLDRSGLGGDYRLWTDGRHPRRVTAIVAVAPGEQVEPVGLPAIGGARLARLVVRSLAPKGPYSEVGGFPADLRPAVTMETPAGGVLGLGEIQVGAGGKKIVVEGVPLEFGGTYLVHVTGADESMGWASVAARLWFPRGQRLLVIGVGDG